MPSERHLAQVDVLFFVRAGLNIFIAAFLKRYDSSSCDLSGLDTSSTSSIPGSTTGQLCLGPRVVPSFFQQRSATTAPGVPGTAWLEEVLPVV